MSVIRKIRIGTTLVCNIEVLTNGEATSLVGRNITVLLVNFLGSSEAMPITISDNNKVSFVYEGSAQTYTGIYRVEVYENIDNVSQSVFDADAFELVSRSSMEEDGVDDLATPIVELTGTINAGVAGRDGKSAYDIYVERGGTLSVDDWLESLKGENGEDGDTPIITVAATSDNTSSDNPTVSVSKTGTDDNPSFSFAFSGLKGKQGDKGDDYNALELHLVLETGMAYVEYGEYTVTPESPMTESEIDEICT